MKIRNPSVIAAVPSRPAKSERWAVCGALPRNLRSSPRAAEHITGRCHPLLPKPARLLSLPLYLTLNDHFSQASPKLLLCNKTVPISRLLEFTTGSGMETRVAHCTAAQQPTSPSRALTAWVLAAFRLQKVGRSRGDLFCTMLDLVDEPWVRLFVVCTKEILSSGSISIELRVSVCWGLVPSGADGLQEYQKPLGLDLPSTALQPQATIILWQGLS